MASTRCAQAQIMALDRANCFGQDRSVMEISRIAEAAALVGDPARANILFALKDEHRLAASELAAVAGVALSTASGHLGLLVEAGMLRVTQQGRYRLYSLAGPGIADALEAIEALAARLTPARAMAVVRDPAIQRARCCYDHLAGTVAVAIADAVDGRGDTAASHDASLPGREGRRRLARIGIDMARLQRSRRQLVRWCPDWSTGTAHLGGALGAAIYARLCALRWLRRVRGSRAVSITPDGAKGLRETFGLSANVMAMR
jgi:DNA-binding transcriptional ArsR family regulator